MGTEFLRRPSCLLPLRASGGNYARSPLTGGYFCVLSNGAFMLTYLYIALGGAIGSVLRAWTSNAFVRVAGADFPWGTIFINVTGSFIIGFFGALTTADGRFTAHSDARAFVMIGICGGFTTFSSFSLQTLNLARDGKATEAFANIALSVVLCLLAVTAGYGAAGIINRGAPQVEALGVAANGGGVVLAVLDRPENAGSVLSSAQRLLGFCCGKATLEALAVHTPPVAELMESDQPLTRQEAASFRAAEESWARDVRAMVRQWEQQARPPLAAKFIEAEGDIGHFVGDIGRIASAIVLGSTRKPGKTHDALHAALFDTARPVLFAPPESGGDFGRVVAVAWKEDGRARKAVLDALPILAKADEVHVLRARVDVAEVPALFREHGIAAEAHVVSEAGGRPVGAQILRMAHELGADLLIMGAYSHGEWREALLGGVTRYVLSHAGLPVFMRH
jgi:protein CrcB